MDIKGTIVDCKRSGTEEVIFRFLILDAPSPSSLPTYVKLLQRQNVHHLVRACGPTYNAELVEKNGIQVHGWTFDDGAPPTRAVMDRWLDLLSQEVGKTPPETIAVHCVAGLGRAPILVALALVEYGNMAPLDAVGYVRERRKGAINQVQLNWLMRSQQGTKRRRTQSSCCWNGRRLTQLDTGDTKGPPDRAGAIRRDGLHDKPLPSLQAIIATSTWHSADGPAETSPHVTLALDCFIGDWGPVTTAPPVMTGAQLRCDLIAKSTRRARADHRDNPKAHQGGGASPMQ
ncbi:Protein-tyrosine phosphatase/Dual specificity phosphatase, catalytic domain containing protein, putative [Leishmania lindenbergi]|uniref:Protein tyrosine phosphatase PRL-1 n=1 Tax=Leishmania lindenbergi TaxID=651832 RepID=A0AAW3APE6_9TRYP